MNKCYGIIIIHKTDVYVFILLVSVAAVYILRDVYVYNIFTVSESCIMSVVNLVSEIRGVAIPDCSRKCF